MLGDKPTALVIYCVTAIGLSVVLPWTSGRGSLASASWHGARLSNPACMVWLMGLVALPMLNQGRQLYVLGCLILSMAVGLLNKRDAISTTLAMFLGLLTASLLPWWLRNERNDLVVSEALLFQMLAVTALSYWMLTRPENMANAARASVWLVRALYAVFGLTGGGARLVGGREPERRRHGDLASLGGLHRPGATGGARCASLA